MSNRRRFRPRLATRLILAMIGVGILPLTVVTALVVAVSPRHLIPTGEAWIPFYTVTGVVALTMVAALSVAGWLIRRWIRPLEQLAQAALALAQGESHTPLPDPETLDHELAQLVQAFQTMRDAVSEREARLRAAESWARSLFEDAPVMYVITRAAPQGPVIADCNRAFLESLGYRREEVVGRPLADFYTPASRTHLERGGYRQALTSGVAEVERQLVRADGQVVETLLRAMPYTDARGRVIGTRAMYVDITQRRQAEAALAQSEQRYRELFLAAQSQAEELRRLNADLAQFNYIISHDLQAPIRVIQGFAQLLQDEVQDNPQAQEHLEAILTGTRRMTRLFQALLIYARSGQQELRREPVALNAVLAEVLAGLQPELEAAQAQVHVADLPQVLGDPHALEILFQNLVTNAVKFRAESPPEIRIWAEETEADVLIYVEDNGRGIPPEQREWVFQLFHRGTNSADLPGSGVGLAVCRRLAERMGGQIWITDGSSGQGTRFAIRLPSSSSGAAASPPAGKDRSKLREIS